MSDMLREIKNLKEKVNTGYGIARFLKEQSIKLIFGVPDGHTLGFYDGLLVIEFPHTNELKVFPWTVNSKQILKKLINKSVDGFNINKIAKAKSLFNDG